ncbi:MAG: HNH endonuclease [Acidimicrobiales bacterium]
MATTGGNADVPLRFADLQGLHFEGEPLRLIGQQGIWTPKGFDTAFSIRTTFTPDDRRRPYEDQIDHLGILKYKYRGTDPNQRENVVLRRAMTRGVGLVYFVGVASGVYLARWPVWIVGDRPDLLEFDVAIDDDLRVFEFHEADRLDRARRRYAERVVEERLHQPVFRARVLQAYESSCAVCRLRHRELLDAAHILPDSHPRGEPIVQNGLALCKIHHAAYDQNLLGIRPDYVVSVQASIMREKDGPMLRHGLQEMDGRKLHVPSSKGALPDRERLEERFETFKDAAP